MDARTHGSRVAHAATPWDWRRRSAVVALVAVGVALFVGAVALGVARGDRVVLVVVNGAAVWLLVTWPALRSLRRWDACAGPGSPR